MSIYFVFINLCSVETCRAWMSDWLVHLSLCDRNIEVMLIFFFPKKSFLDSFICCAFKPMSHNSNSKHGIGNVFDEPNANCNNLIPNNSFKHKQLFNIVRAFITLTISLHDGKPMKLATASWASENVSVRERHCCTLGHDCWAVRLWLIWPYHYRLPCRAAGKRLRKGINRSYPGELWTANGEGQPSALIFSVIYATWWWLYAKSRTRLSFCPVFVNEPCIVYTYAQLPTFGYFPTERTFQWEKQERVYLHHHSTSLHQHSPIRSWAQSPYLMLPLAESANKISSARKQTQRTAAGEMFEYHPLRVCGAPKVPLLKSKVE